MTVNKQANNMVENINNGAYGRVINRENICKELVRLGLLSSFTGLQDDKKFEYIISNANYDIVDWHVKLSKRYRKSPLSYVKWSELVFKEFGTSTLTLGDVYRLSQKANRGIAEYIEEVKSQAAEFDISDREIINILLNGMNKGSEDLKLIILKAGSVDNIDLDHISKAEKVIEDAKATKDDLIKLLKKLEGLSLRKEGEPMKCNYCKMRGHTEEFCRKRKQKNFKPDKKKTINEMSGKAEEKLDELINKDSLVYIEGSPFRAIFDTGSDFNFISKKVLEVLKIKSHNNFKSIKFYTCLDQPFFVKKHVFLEVSYKGRLTE